MKEKKGWVLLLNEMEMWKEKMGGLEGKWEEGMGIWREGDMGEVVVGGEVLFWGGGERVDVVVGVRDMVVWGGEDEIDVRVGEGKEEKVKEEWVGGYCDVLEGDGNVSVVDE